MDQSGGNNQFAYQGTPPSNVQNSSIPPAPTPTAQSPAATNSNSITWNASEFIDHQKSFGWFLPLILVVVAASGLMFLITRSVLSTIVVFMGGITFTMIARQKPRTLSYSLTPTGVIIGEKQYAYDDFRTFSVLQDGGMFSIYLEPVRRFLPPLTFYFAPDDGEKIFDALAQHIPHQERSTDPVDRLMRKIRF